MSQADYVLSFPSVTVEANPSPTVVPDELEAAELDMQEDEVEIFEIEPAAVEKPAELGPASKQITVSVRSEVTVSYETADPSLEARGLIKMLLGVQSCLKAARLRSSPLPLIYEPVTLDWKPLLEALLI